jgi:hypothetical protein
MVMTAAWARAQASLIVPNHALPLRAMIVRDPSSDAREHGGELVYAEWGPANSGI